MKIIRYQNSPLFNPVAGYTSLRDEMDRLFDVAFPALSSLQREGFPGNRQGEFPIDIYQDKEATFVRAELPGFRKEDISVEVADGTLTVTAHQKTETDKSGQKDKATTTQERRFTRAVTLPENLQLDRIHAAYANGVLTVTLPKSEKVKPRQIAVDVK